ncbi:uncharacterized protein PgNI_09744 [Pyricularia grisea]|uniref:RCM-1 n=1 Tax=Pyricularia grisea TaxID=148305 RepID=A0A6P8ASV8_PYRGI|nr:uncharacterized protein PgNI_09744 [Pyricularia grisea]TLD05209.1 hypothetical protein PgNI_09744 [Pyricularia grisea]
MASHRPSPPMPVHMHHGPGAPLPPGAMPPGPQYSSAARRMAEATEVTWIQIGSCSEILGNLEDAMQAYERAITINPQSIPAMNAMSAILRTKEEFPKACEYLNAIIKLDPTNGEAWSAMGHCYLMMDELQQAYSAYQNALVNLQTPKDPKLWYGIGILYDRYGSLEHAEEAFSSVMQMQPDFEKANEIYFRLGIIYKQQSKFNQSLECFKYIVHSPPHPLTETDIWFQIGHVHEQQKDLDNAKAAYQRVLDGDPKHAKVLQQLGWLHHQQSSSFQSQERAIEYLEQSVAADNSDAQSWYLLGRCYMSQQKYPKAYEAYQQAVYRDGRNPTFWCSIGVLYYQINQYRDALDAYSRAIRLNPYLSEVWYDLGTLYESCNNQINDALDAYQRAAELDPSNPHIKARLNLLRTGQSNGSGPPSAPVPTDIHPQSYQASGPPGPQWNGVQGPQPPQQPNGPPPLTGPDNWPRLSAVNPPPQPPNPYEQQREPFRGPPPPPPRQPSPRQEQGPPPMRHYGQEGARPGPPPGPGPEPPRRGPSPIAQGHYPPPPPPPGQQPPPPQSMQQAQQQAQQQQQQHHHQAQQQQAQQAQQQPQQPRQSIPMDMVRNSRARQFPDEAMDAPPPPNAMLGYRRPNSPRSEQQRPAHDNRMPSPKSAYPQHQQPYPPHPNDTPGPSNVDGPSRPPPPPPPGGSNPEPPMHREHDRPPSVGPKRMREWEDEPTSAKKPASDENRARLEDLRHRRQSTPPREREQYRRNSSEARRFEDQRRMDDQRRVDEHRRDDMRRAEEQRHANDNYHPSEAAHHPPAHAMQQSHLPPMQQGPVPPMQNMMRDGPGPSPAGSAPKEFNQEERHHERQPQHPAASHAPAAGEPERAARKMDVDEDYDDSGEDEKKNGIATSAASGPGSSSGESKPATNGAMNGLMGPKVESS